MLQKPVGESRTFWFFLEKMMVSIGMGSDEDLKVKLQAVEMLDFLEIVYDLDKETANRTPEKLFEFSAVVYHQGAVAIFAGAGADAHPSVKVANISPIQVIGVPKKPHSTFYGWSSVLPLLHMPGGVSCAATTLNRGKNTWNLPGPIVSGNDESILQKIIEYKRYLKQQVVDKAEKLKRSINPSD